MVSGSSQVGQSVFLLDNDVHSFTLVRPCSGGLTSLRIFCGPHVTCGGGDGRPNRSLAGRAQQVAGAENRVDRWMPLLGDAGEGLPIAPLGELAQELRVALGSSAGAVMGGVDIPISVAHSKAARRFNA